MSDSPYVLTRKPDDPPWAGRLPLPPAPELWAFFCTCNSAGGPCRVFSTAAYTPSVADQASGWVRVETRLAPPTEAAP